MRERRRKTVYTISPRYVTRLERRRDRRYLTFCKMEKGIRKVETATYCILEGRQVIGWWRLEMQMDMDVI
jgi:hypothetical protein